MEEKEDDDKSVGQEQNFSLPLSSKDSRWCGITFQKALSSPGHASDEERVIQLIEPGNEIEPLLLLFPEIRNDRQTREKILSRQLSPTSIAKVLVGKKPDFSMLKSSEKLADTYKFCDDDLDDEDYEQFLKAKRAKLKHQQVDILSNLDEELEDEDSPGTNSQ